MTTPPMPPSGGVPPWRQQPSPPGFARRRRLWIIVGISMLVVVTAVVGMLIWQGTSSSTYLGADDSSSTASGAINTVGLLREKDPVCDDWFQHADQLAAETRQWGDMDKAVPKSNWSPRQREIFEAAAESIAEATRGFESILPLAQHPALQELIAQTIVYWRLYVERLSSYAVEDGKLAGVASNFGGAVTFMCTAIPLVPPSQGGVSPHTASSPDPSALTPFMREVDSNCSGFLALVERQNTVLSGWQATDPLVPASQWTPEQRRLNDAAANVIAKDADQAQAIADASKNQVLADLLRTYAAYAKAYVDAILSYVPDDDQLWRVATYIGGGLASACKAQP